MTSNKDFEGRPRNKEYYVQKHEYDFDYDYMHITYTDNIDMAHVFTEDKLSWFKDDLVRYGHENDDSFLEKEVERSTVISNHLKDIIKEIALKEGCSNV
ncbi:MAG: hypothetical protein ACRC0G_02465 [Fusobacteriaceae bacterium]